MSWSFKDKVALVTGAGSGMGLATAQAFAAAGAAVTLADANEDVVRALARELVAAGHKAIAVRCDVTDDDQVAAMIQRTVNEFGRLDAAFNNAGIMVPAVELADVSREVYDRVIAINLRGVWSCMKYELLQMRKQGSGVIVNNSSIGGVVGVPGRAIYHASKHGVIGLTRSAALEYAAKGIRINAVCPGTIDTPMVAEMLAKEPDAMKEILRDMPIGRLGKPKAWKDPAITALQRQRSTPSPYDSQRSFRPQSRSMRCVPAGCGRAWAARAQRDLRTRGLTQPSGLQRCRTMVPPVAFFGTESASNGEWRARRVALLD